MVYNIENIETVCKADLCFRVKDDILLETLLMEIWGKNNIICELQKQSPKGNRKKLYRKKIGSLRRNLVKVIED